MKCMTRSLSVTPKTTLRSGKSDCRWLLRNFVPDLLQCGLKMLRYFTTNSLPCGRLLAWRHTCGSQQQWPVHHVSALATSVFLPVKLYTCHWCSTTCIENLSNKTVNLSTSTLFTITNFTSQWRHTYVVFRQLLPRFLSISTGMRILMLEMCWRHFNKLALKLQIKTAFQQIWYIYLIMLV